MSAIKPIGRHDVLFPGTVRIGGLRGLRELVGELGGDPAFLLERCGLAARAFDDDDNTIPLPLGAQLSQVAARDTGCAHFGLLLGSRHDLTILGPVGHLVRHCPDVRTALASLLQHMHLQVTGTAAALTTAGKLAHFTYAVQSPLTCGCEQVYNVCMAYQVRLLQLLCGPSWRAHAIHLATPVPANRRQVQDFFGVPVKFEQPLSAVVFAAEWLERPIDGADAGLHAIVLQHIRRLEAPRSDGFVQRLRRVIRSLLPTGACTAERVAQMFGTNRRMLHRLLAAQATTFEGELDAVRCALARQSLLQTQVSLTALSQALGYRDPSAFTRAFRRWTSMSPSEWRRSR